jgi:hypothetical protein
MMKLDNLVRFSSHPRPFLVNEVFCSNPDCCCNQVFLNFTEVSDSGGSLNKPVSFSVRIDLEGWQECDPPQRSPQVSAWVREFLNDCPPTRRAEYKASYEEERRLARRRAEYTIGADEVLDGTLVSHVNILAPQSALSAGGNAYTFDVRHHGREYLVEDRYCPNPDCDCQSVHLEFFEAVSQSNGKLRIYQRFLGKVTFAGRLSIEERMKCNLAEANAVLSAWWQEFGDELEMLKDRYREVKEVGRRSLKTGPSRRVAARRATTGSIVENVSPDEQPIANIKVGRNDSCPCGSGKKYKKCCLRKVGLPI